MRTPRRRATYTPTLRQAYDQTVAAIGKALQMPIKYAGPGHWTVFAAPARYSRRRSICCASTSVSADRPLGRVKVAERE
jgi:hypothetical protein